MPFALTVRDEDRVRTLGLRGAADVASAGELHRALLEALVPGRATVLDLREVERLDTAGIQLLLAARAWVAKHGGVLTATVGDGPAATALRLSGALSHLPLTQPEREVTRSQLRRETP